LACDNANWHVIILPVGGLWTILTVSRHLEGLSSECSGQVGR